MIVKNAANRLNDSNEGACHSLRELKKLIATIHALVEKSLRSESSSSVRRNVQNAKRAFFSGSRLREVNNAADKLSSIQQGLMLAMIADQLPSEDVLLALKITQIAGSSRALKLVKRRMEGKVVFDELTETGDDVLGQGSFGQVTAGEYYGKPVAIKKTLNSAQLGREERAMFG